MGIGATIFMMIFFPLNTLLFFNQNSIVLGIQAKTKEGSIEELKEKNTLIVTENDIEKKDEIKILKTQASDSPKYQPVRKNDIADLKLPQAHASVILDADTGTILHYNQGREQRQIASLTKIMTAVLVMEKIENLDDFVTIDEEAVYAEGTKIGCPRSGYCISQRLKVGEKISAKNLLKAMLMNSANDAAIALAKHISGTQENFVKVMNQKAKDLGLVDTNFCTASGLEIDGIEKECFSSAYDIARIASYSLRYDLMWKMFRLPNNTEITSYDGEIKHTILNTDLILDELPDVIGGKTGFTPLAGYSLLMAISDPSQKHRIITVLLNDPTRWQDIKLASNWAFNSHIWQ